MLAVLTLTGCRDCDHSLYVFNSTPGEVHALYEYSVETTLPASLMRINSLPRASGGSAVLFRESVNLNHSVRLSILCIVLLLSSAASAAFLYNASGCFSNTTILMNQCRRGISLFAHLLYRDIM